MRGLIDLHCHYIPGIDDGVTTIEAGVELCVALARIGYEKVIATPHIRTAMFENRKENLIEAFAAFEAHVASMSGLPALGLAAEHYCDDVFWELFQHDQAMPYPGGKAALIEFPNDHIPVQVEERFFRMNVRGVRPVLAHPERYSPLFRSSDPLERMLDIGVLPLLDIMSLVGKYGRKPRSAAERMLEEGVYYAACSDCHRPADVEFVQQAIERLCSLVGDTEANQLLSEHPRQILEGTAE